MSSTRRRLRRRSAALLSPNIRPWRHDDVRNVARCLRGVAVVLRERMADEREEWVEIDAKGVARPLGETAALRMQGRQGRFSVLSSPAHLLGLRKLEAKRCVGA